MIILRQKEYSKKSTQITYKIGKLRNKAKTFPSRFLRGIYEQQGKLGKRATADSIVKEKTKSKIQLMKEAIEKDNKRRSNINEALIASTTKEGARKYIGDKTGKFVEMAAENPISTASIAFGYGSTPIQLASPVKYWGPIGEIGTIAEQAAKRKSPKYKRATEKMSELAKKKHWREKVGRTAEIISGSIL